MRLIDNIKDFTADLEDYVKLKDQEIALLEARLKESHATQNELVRENRGHRNNVSHLQGQLAAANETELKKEVTDGNDTRAKD